MELEFSTKISVEQGHRLNRIRVQGEGHTIVSVVDKIYAIFEEVEAKEREEYHADIVAKQVGCPVIHKYKIIRIACKLACRNCGCLPFCKVDLDLANHGQFFKRALAAQPPPIFAPTI